MEPNGVLLKNAKSLLNRYFRHRVGRESAALAYYMFFSLFPFLVFLLMVLSALDMPLDSFLSQLSASIPRDVFVLIESYIGHASEYSGALMFFGLFFTLWFFSRTVNSIMHAIAAAYHAGGRRSLVKHYALVLLFTVTVMAATFASLLLIVINRSLLGAIASFFSISDGFVAVWGYLRYVILAAVLFFLLALLYSISPCAKLPAAYILPGAGAALASWLAISSLLDFFVQNLSRYSLLYGSLCGIIVLLIWFYLSGTIIIMGAELNGLLRQNSKKRGVK